MKQEVSKEIREYILTKYGKDIPEDLPEKIQKPTKKNAEISIEDIETYMKSKYKL